MAAADLRKWPPSEDLSGGNSDEWQFSFQEERGLESHIGLKVPKQVKALSTWRHSSPINQELQSTNFLDTLDLIDTFLFYPLTVST